MAGYFGLNAQIAAPINDKVLHFVCFFLLTIALYWSLDLPRRLLLKVILLSVTIILSIGSEVLQEVLPNGRQFDLLDIAANVVGSASALALCSWYHKRMLERRRRRKVQGYGIVPAGEGEDDVELGLGSSAEEMGIAQGEEDDDGAEAWDEIAANDEGDLAMQHVEATPVESRD